MMYTGFNYRSSMQLAQDFYDVNSPNVVNQFEALESSHLRGRMSASEIKPSNEESLGRNIFGDFAEWLGLAHF